MGFNANDLSRHLRVSKRRVARLMELAGVRRRIRYLSGDGKPVFALLTRAEAKAVLREYYRQRGARIAAREMRGLTGG